MRLAAHGNFKFATITSIATWADTESGLLSAAREQSFVLTLLE